MRKSCAIYVLQNAAPKLLYCQDEESFRSRCESNFAHGIPNMPREPTRNGWRKNDSSRSSFCFRRNPGFGRRSGLRRNINKSRCSHGYRGSTPRSLSSSFRRGDDNGNGSPNNFALPVANAMSNTFASVSQSSAPTEYRNDEAAYSNPSWVYAQPLAEIIATSKHALINAGLLGIKESSRTARSRNECDRSASVGKVRSMRADITDRVSTLYESLL